MDSMFNRLIYNEYNSYCDNEHFRKKLYLQYIDGRETRRAFSMSVYLSIYVYIYITYIKIYQSIQK